MKNPIQKETMKKIWTAAQFVMILVWLSQLIYTDSYFSVYALCGGVAILSLYDNNIHHRNINSRKSIAGGALFLSLAVTLSNYPIFQRVRNLHEISLSTNSFLNVFEAVLTFVCGLVVFFQIFLCLAGRFPMVCQEDERCVTGKRPALVFLSAFSCFSGIYLIYLFFVAYPGSFTSDTIHQINQIYRNSFTSMHPFWHTMSIKVAMSIGYFLFKDTNAAAATFSAFQSLAMAAIFAYAVVTLYQYRLPKIWVALTFLAFACLPNHITYSCTAWKDVPFGLAMLLLITAIFRILRGVGKYKKLNYLMLLLGGIGGCMMRSNVGTSMAVAFLVLGFLFRRKCRELLAPCLVMVVAVWLLTGPVLDLFYVNDNNFIEGLAIPLQQVARVITEGCELTQEETAFIDTMLDIEKVPEKYTPECVDPIKDMIHEKNYWFLQEYRGDFFRHWINIGLRYPWEYIKAWVDETKGYWNGGYDYYIYAQYVSENDYGMYMVRQTNLIHKLVKAYFTLTRETVFFEPLQSIGFHVWILMALGVLNLLKGRKELLLIVPVLALVVILWCITPVFSEFRYAYSVFTTMPFLLPVSLCCKPEEEN